MKSKSVQQNDDGTLRALSNRHVQMIAIGGTIGTGLFLGSGSTISKTGPSVILVYLVLGGVFYLMMRAMGRCFTRIPHSTPSCRLFPNTWGTPWSFHGLDVLDWAGLRLHGGVNGDCGIRSVLVP